MRWEVWYNYKEDYIWARWKSKGRYASMYSSKENLRRIYLREPERASIYIASFNGPKYTLP